MCITRSISSSGELMITSLSESALISCRYYVTDLEPLLYLVSRSSSCMMCIRVLLAKVLLSMSHDCL